jgi:transcriptional regulator with XRE-family HTH domain
MSPDQSKSAAARALGDAIRAAREQAGLTAGTLATRAGLDASAYEAIERGEQQSDVETIEQIARALGLSAAKLLARAKL